MLNIGDKAIYKPNWKNHKHDGMVITIIGFTNLKGYVFSIDDFPECNGREWKNTWQCLYSEVKRDSLKAISFYLH